MEKECILVGCVPSVAVAISRGGGCLPQCMLGYQPLHPGHGTPWSRQPPGSRPPREQTPPSQSRHPYPLDQAPPSRHPPEQTPPRADTSWEQTPPRSRHPPEQTLPRGVGTPCGQTDACENITFATSLRTVKVRKRVS